MANPTNIYQPAIDELERELLEVERRGNALISTINLLRDKSGLPPRPPSNTGGSPESGGSSSLPTQIKSDTFFGKKLQSAARQYLEMRRAQGGDGPAKPREIFEALKAGGFEFDAKDDNISTISLRNMLRKRSETFQKFSNGTYGLCIWYPDAKKRKPTVTDIDDDNDDADDDNNETTEQETATPKGAAA